MIETHAWVLVRGEPHVPGELELRTVTLPGLTDSECLVEPIIGSWEANMTHALERRPIDVCRERGEPWVILGNTGVVRVLATGRDVEGLSEGDLCMVFGVDPDRRPFSMPQRAWAYDDPGSHGLLAKRTRIKGRQLFPIRTEDPALVARWAAFSGRYLAAWPNFQLAHATYRALVTAEEHPRPFAFGWGGGVSLAALELAKMNGYRCAMVASTGARLALLRSKGFEAIDRRDFADLCFDEERHEHDPEYRQRYRAAEKAFLARVRALTGKMGAALFFDHIGAPVTRATQRALGCPGVLATAGWKHGMRISSVRALECMGWHTHVHTHCARPVDVRASMEFARASGWLPDPVAVPRPFEDVPALASDYTRGLDTYFPLYQVNRL